MVSPVLLFLPACLRSDGQRMRGVKGMLMVKKNQRFGRLSGPPHDPTIKTKNRVLSYPIVSSAHPRSSEYSYRV